MSDLSTRLLIAQEELAQLTGLRRNTISRLKRGVHKHAQGFPKPRTIGNRQYYDAQAFMAWFKTLPIEELGTIQKGTT